MRITQADIDSLTAKLNDLTDAEKMALRVAIAAQSESEVSGFTDRDPEPSSFLFEKIEWVWKAPAGREVEGATGGKGFLDYEWIA